MKKLFEELKFCYGCFACSDACSNDAITVKNGSDSFFYPEINSKKCIDCNQCLSVCPSGKIEKLLDIPVSSFAGIIKNSEDEKRSSSGGAFKSIVKACKEYNKDKYKEFYLAGCIWSEEFKVEHRLVRINSDSDIDQFCKSKYVNSMPKGVYKTAKSLMNNPDSFVIFSGTPCQVAAFRNYVGETYDNYLCIDLICHGAPSQEAFDKYKTDLENKHGSKLVDYEFRTKEILDNGTLYTRSAKYEFENGKVLKVSRLEDDYLKKFYEKCYIVRESCVDCVFHRPERVGDITIGDAWGIDTLYKDVIPIKGCSYIIISKRALKFEQLIRSFMHIFEVPYSFMIEHNTPLRRN